MLNNIDYIDIILLGDKAFSLLFFPILGFIIDKSGVNLKIIKNLKYLISVLLLPYLFSFYFFIPYLSIGLMVLLFSLFYSEYLRNADKKVKKTGYWSLSLLIVLSIWLFISTIAATTKNEQVCAKEEYSIYRYSEQGFAGRPLIEYELCQKAIIPFYIKSIETKRMKINECIINFKKDINFDHCNNKFDIK